MASNTLLAAVRDLLDGITASIAVGHRHVDLPSVCEVLGLPAPPSEGTKRERMAAGFAAMHDDDLLVLARNILVGHPLEPSRRNELQDLVW
nr:hypothetical protein [Streptomyces sp. SID5474]